MSTQPESFTDAAYSAAENLLKGTFPASIIELSSSLSLSSAYESILSIKPIFDFKSSNETINHNITFLDLIAPEGQFESKEFVDKIALWIKGTWHYSFLFAFIYMISIWFGTMYMRSRPRYELRLPLILWNIFLAVFSILGTIRVWPSFFETLYKDGIVHSVCDNNYAYSRIGFWSFMFVMSKLPELVDTLFIVFRKQQLIFLHWYHHATVLIYCWYSFRDFTSTGRWFLTMNYLIHAVMYSYYAFKAMKFKVPVFISQLITTSQLIQMVAGCYVNWVAYQTKKNSPQTSCQISYENIYFSMLMYLSYFLLFFKYYWNAYVSPSKSKTARLTPTTDSNGVNSKSNNQAMLDENGNLIKNGKMTKKNN